MAAGANGLISIVNGATANTTDLTGVSALAISNDGSVLYAASGSGNMVYELNALTLGTISALVVSGGPSALSLSTDGNFLYVADTTGNVVTVLATGATLAAGTTSGTGGILALVQTVSQTNAPDLSMPAGIAGVYWLWYRVRNAWISVAASALVAALLWTRVSGEMLTVAWGFEGLALLGCGFGMRERALRLQGLGMLLACILKLFLYDLRNLDTFPRILSFIALGAIMLGVSWIYTRFRDQLKSLL